MTETVLKSVRQHPIKLFFRLAQWVGISAVIIGTAWFLKIPALFGVAAAALAFGIWKEQHRHAASVLKISDQRVVLSVRKGLFRSFEIGLHYSQIINCTFVKSNFLHAVTGSGTLYMRASEKPEGQIVAEFVPNVEDVCRMINLLIPMDESKRREWSGELETQIASSLTPEDVRKKISSLAGVVASFELNGKDRSFVFDHEEDRNHGVYEAIRRSHAVCLVCNQDFRKPPKPVHFKTTKRSVLPGVPFPETGRPDTVSGCPSKPVHNYLVDRSGYKVAADEFTVVVGFE